MTDDTPVMFQIFTGPGSLPIRYFVAPVVPDGENLIITNGLKYETVKEGRYVKIIGFKDTSLPKEHDRAYSLNSDMVTLVPITEEERAFISEV